MDSFKKSHAIVAFDFFHQFGAEDTLRSLLLRLQIPAIENARVIGCYPEKGPLNTLTPAEDSGN